MGFLLAVVWLAVPPAAAGPSSACPPAAAEPELHSHNDYTREHPLYDALAEDFDSVEADVFLVDGRLLIGHQRSETRPDRTLESEYLRPMLELFRKNGGWVRSSRKSLGLLIECKTKAAPCYQALAPLLSRYQEMLTRHGAGLAKPGAVTAILTGHEARSLVAGDERRLISLDGDLGDLGSAAPADLIPWISSDWENLHWRRGVARGLNFDRMAKAACDARRQGRRLRIWGGPDDEEAWAAECAAGIDILNTDHLARARAFLAQCRRLRR